MPAPDFSAVLVQRRKQLVLHSQLRLNSKKKQTSESFDTNQHQYLAYSHRIIALPENKNDSDIGFSSEVPVCGLSSSSASLSNVDNPCKILKQSFFS